MNRAEVIALLSPSGLGWGGLSPLIELVEITLALRWMVSTRVLAALAPARPAVVSRPLDQRWDPLRELSPADRAVHR
ncbi:hypothetical protein [Gordonia jacobaea]|uniref:hypothetical protein n=1 Tax=Gordonia jacobaea TaxID=122202 RepID=UPI0022E7A2F2|nr:hypothetical protein [Gordonia jacobaea]